MSPTPGNCFSHSLASSRGMSPRKSRSSPPRRRSISPRVCLIRSALMSARPPDRIAAAMSALVRQHDVLPRRKAGHQGVKGASGVGIRGVLGQYCLHQGGHVAAVRTPFRSAVFPCQLSGGSADAFVAGRMFPEPTRLPLQAAMTSIAQSRLVRRGVL